MVDLNLYEGTVEPRRLLVPELRGKLVHETRQVVRVKIEGEQPKAKIEVERLPDPSRAERTVWTPEAFLQALATADVAPEFRELVKRFTSIPQRHASTSIAFGSGKLGSVTLRRSGSSILSLFLDGRAETKPASYIEKALGQRDAPVYQEAVARLWGPEFVNGWGRPTAAHVIQQGPQLLIALDEALRAAEKGGSQTTDA